MKTSLKNKLIEIARTYYSDLDPSHSFSHIERVLLNAEKIAKTEKEADLEVIVRAVLFHDVVTYAKNDPRNKLATEESATKAQQILMSIPEFPKEKIKLIKSCINKTSFSKGLRAETIEERILQDADMLEATGAISIMRTFTTGGVISRALYDTKDPFAKKRQTDDFKYSLDLFYSRLLKVKDRMNTKEGKRLAKRRTEFLHKFLEELTLEINGK